MPKEHPKIILDPKKLLFALEASELGLWELNIQTGRGNVDQRWAEMLGYKLGEIESTMEFWGEIVHPEDHEGCTIRSELFQMIVFQMIVFQMIVKLGISNCRLNLSFYI